ncbi:cutinase family protein [Actinoplanes sp. CA-131856]
MKRILSVLVLVVATLTAAPHAASAAGPNCGDVLFVGVAGSGESGMGAEVTAVYNAVKAKAKGRTVTAYALPYKAAAVPVMLIPGNGIARYMESLIGGEEKLNTFLFERIRRCPGERLVLAGYSQGAMLVHRSMQILGTRVTDRVDAIALVGDGDRLPGDDGQMLGTAGARAKGVGQWYPRWSQANGRKFGSGLGGRVFSLCHTLDIVCDHKPAAHTTRAGIGVGIALHTSYRLGSQLTDLGAKVAGKLRRDALTVYRPSGRAGFVSYVTGFSCPAVASGYVLVVARGAGQSASEAFTDVDSSTARVGSSENAAPGTYTATVTCEASTDPNVRTGGRTLVTYTFTQTVTTTSWGGR